jgi:transcriptional regulator with XRE-family HTH domain
LDLKTAFALTIKEIRKEKKLSQEKVAYRCFCQTVIIGRLETAQREPKISTIFKIANALEVTPDYLIKKVAEKLSD